MDINKRLKDIVTSLHDEHTDLKEKVINAINHCGFHDSFLADTQTNLRITEMLLMLLDLSKDFVSSDEFEAAHKTQIKRLIQDKQKRLEKRESDIILHAPNPDHVIELFAIRRIQFRLKEALN